MVSRAGFSLMVEVILSSIQSVRKSPVFRHAASCSTLHTMRHFWRIPAVFARPCSHFVRLCYRNGPFVSSGQLRAVARSTDAPVKQARQGYRALARFRISCLSVPSVHAVPVRIRGEGGFFADLAYRKT